MQSLRSYAPINDGEFHSVKAELIPSKIILLVDDEVDHTVQIELATRRWPLEKLFPGGSDNTLVLGGTSESSVNFEGCIDKFYFDEHYIPLGYQPGWQNVTLNGLGVNPEYSAMDFKFLQNDPESCVSHGCQDLRNFCETENNPCQNGARCIQGFNSYTCECDDGFTGENCDLYVICNEVECNSGTCNANGTCDCYPGFEGGSCEVNIDECIKNDCTNNSTCIDGINGYRKSF